MAQESEPLVWEEPWPTWKPSPLLRNPTVKETHARQKEERRRTPRAPLETDALIFRAYDCSTPLEVTSLTTKAAPSCDHETTEPSPAARKYSLLQRAPHIRFPVTRCQVVRTQIWHHCGMHSHSAIMPLEWTIEEEVHVAPEECRTAWETKKMKIRTKTGKQVSHTLRLNGTSYLRTSLAGQTYSNMRCQGEEIQWSHMQQHKPWKRNGYGMIGYEHTKVMLHKVWATTDPTGIVTIEDDRVQLPCPLDHKGCITDRATTYVWDPPTEKDRCPFFLTRDVEGVEVPDEEGKPVFVSTDGSMLRLDRGSPQSHCGGIIYQTQYPQLFLAPRGPGVVVIPEFRRPVHPSVMSPTTYTNQQDSFIFHKLIEEMNERFMLAQKARCEDAATKATAEYARRAAEQHAILDGETVHIGRGQFVTASGEVWYHYQCYPVTVRARETEGCYSSLPVTLTQKDFDRYLQARGRPNATDPVSKTKGFTRRGTVFTAKRNQFFLEPRTHRLTTVAVPSRCVTPFVPLYQNQHGQWIAYDGRAFSRAPAPGTIEGTSWELTGPPPTPDYDFPTSGVYTLEQTEDMDSYRQVNTAGKGVVNVLGFQLDEQPEPDQPLNPSSFLPNLPALDDPIFGSILNKFLSWVKVYGELCSIVVASLLFFRLASWLVGIILRLSTISLSANPLMHILWACCPTVHGFLEAPARWCRNLACCQVQERPDSLRTGRRSGIYRPNDQDEDIPRTELQPLNKRPRVTEPSDADQPPTYPAASQAAGAATPAPAPSAPLGQLVHQAAEHAASVIYPGLANQEPVAATLPPLGGHRK